jgi:hypothetical protein
VDFINLASNPTDESGARDLGLSPKNLIKQSDEKGRRRKELPFWAVGAPSNFQAATFVVVFVCVQSFPAAARWAMEMREKSEAGSRQHHRECEREPGRERERAEIDCWCISARRLSVGHPLRTSTVSSISAAATKQPPLHP